MPSGWAAWQRAAVSAAWLAVEAPMVVALRCAKLAAGGAAAEAESRRMVIEKWQVAAALPWAWLRLGATGRGHLATGHALGAYRRRVRANRRRLLRNLAGGG